MRGAVLLAVADTAGALTGVDVHFADEQQWWDWHWSFSLRGVLEQLDSAAVDAMRDASFERMAALKTANGYPMHLYAWVVTGRRG